MTRRLVLLVSTIFALITAFTASAALAAPSPSTIGAMSGEPRGPDKRINIPGTIEALQRLNVNTFYYLIWPNEHDWEDLPAFADAAAKADITVWVYLVPWSETPPHKEHGWGFSEPFKNDYVRWGSEIGKLSRAHPNIAGWVMDDFYDNTKESDRFSTGYVRKMVQAGRAANPKLKFYPLMYFHSPWDEFVDRFGSIVDGVVICYPKSEAGVRNVLTHLRGRRHGPTVIERLQRNSSCEAGEGATAAADLAVSNARDCELSFYFDSNDRGVNSARHVARVRLNGRTVWSHEMTGAGNTDGIYSVDLSRFVRNGQRVHLEFGLVCTRSGETQSSVVARYDDIRVYGFGRNANSFPTALGFHGAHQARYEASIDDGGGAATPPRTLPVILMPSGEEGQYEVRYDQPPSPQGVAKLVRMSLDVEKQGLADGVVPYRIPLKPGDPVFEAIAREMSQPSTSREPSARPRRAPESR